MSPTLTCCDCKTNRFVPPAMLCAFCPECPGLIVGLRKAGPYKHSVCPECDEITLCLDHALCDGGLSGIR